MIFMLQTPKQKELYLLELENGNDTKKSVEKCIKHGQAIFLGSANEKYHHKMGYRTLWIFRTGRNDESNHRKTKDKIPSFHP